MKLVIIMDTHSFKLKLIDDVLQRIAFNPRNDRVESVTLYTRGVHDCIFDAHIRRNFPGAEMRYNTARIPVRPGKQPNWRSVIRNEIAKDPDAGFQLTIVVSERFDSVYYNLVHTGIMHNIKMARTISPAVSDAINFTRIDGVRNYFADGIYTISSLNVYKG